MLGRLAIALPLLLAGKGEGIDSSSPVPSNAQATADILEGITFPIVELDVGDPGAASPAPASFKLRKVDSKNTPVIAPPTNWTKEQLSTAISMVESVSATDSGTLEEFYCRAITRVAAQSDATRYATTLKNTHCFVMSAIYAGHSDEEIAGVVGLGIRQSEMGANIDDDKRGWLGLTTQQQEKLEHRINLHLKDRLGEKDQLGEPLKVSQEIKDSLVLLELLADARELFSIHIGRSPNADEQKGNLVEYLGHAVYFVENPNRLIELRAAHSSFTTKDEEASRIRSKFRRDQAGDREAKRLTALESELTTLKDRISTIFNEAAESSASYITDDHTRTSMTTRFLQNSTTALKSSRKLFKS